MRDSGGTTYIVNGQKQKFFLKIAGEAFQDTIRQSVDIVRYLSEKGFPVSAIIETKLGMPILEAYDEGQEYLLVLYEYIDGKEPDLCTCGEKINSLITESERKLSIYPNQ